MATSKGQKAGLIWGLGTGDWNLSDGLIPFPPLNPVPYIPVRSPLKSRVHDDVYLILATKILSPCFIVIRCAGLMYSLGSDHTVLA